VYDPATAIDFTIYRLQPSGSPRDRDVFGAQQYAPLLGIEVAAPRAARTDREGPWQRNRPHASSRLS